MKLLSSYALRASADESIGIDRDVINQFEITCTMVKVESIDDAALRSPDVPPDKCGDVGPGTAGRFNTTQGIVLLSSQNPNSSGYTSF
jgi:hypothetical protein